MKCSKCGFENDSDALFCEKCGTSLSSERVNNVSWIRRNWSWLCVFAGLLFLLICKLSSRRSDDWWAILFAGLFVWISKVLIPNAMIARWVICILFCVGTFFLFTIIAPKNIYGPNGEVIGQSGAGLGLFFIIAIILVWAYSIIKENSNKFC